MRPASPRPRTRTSSACLATLPASTSLVQSGGNVYDHPIADQWRAIGTSIYEFLDSQSVKWTSIDHIAFAEEKEVVVFCPLLMWIGVQPASLMYDAAKVKAIQGDPRSGRLPRDRSRLPSQPAEEIVALGTEGYENAVTNMLRAIGRLATLIAILLPKLTEGKVKDTRTAKKRKELLDLVNSAQEKIEDINKLHGDVTKFRTAASHHTIGFVLHVEPIERIDWASFQGNKVYVAENLSSNDYCEIMFPRVEDRANYKFPRSGLLQAYGVVKAEEMRSPQHLDANGYSRPPSSADEDSGAIILDWDGRIGMLTGDGGSTDAIDTTYLTPYWWLEEQIKKAFPGFYLYEVQSRGLPLKKLMF
ncbi:hypothetical protein EUX98_g2875 [Antrodiella citrinella]|uniref:Uncharacterized protein n=1 Tax=Antrodiella citrinella TaxID=2447956 RepID=A0A4S4N676_9APHY|nr:hypothetical protein EUX98_g2875 [Antrodiella citrinella]